MTCAFFCPPTRLPSGELTWQLKSPIFNGRYIFKRCIFCCHVSLPERNRNGMFYRVKTSRWVSTSCRVVPPLLGVIAPVTRLFSAIGAPCHSIYNDRLRRPILWACALRNCTFSRHFASSSSCGLGSSSLLVARKDQITSMNGPILWLPYGSSSPRPIFRMS